MNLFLDSALDLNDNSQRIEDAQSNKLKLMSVLLMQSCLHNVARLVKIWRKSINIIKMDKNESCGRRNIT